MDAGSEESLPRSCVALQAAFASKPAPTFDRIPPDRMQSNVGAGLLAKRPSASTRQGSSPIPRKITLVTVCIAFSNCISDNGWCSFRIFT
ncbi:hypothetical protein C7A11_11135 [Pseudomonas simiae]|nr:hypothetical protein C7A11_11135 [Pseudomonas simiae]TKK10571.1 hypothetical protein PflCFBP13514_01375 [Pseudomonas fluorescens]